MHSFIYNPAYYIFLVPLLLISCAAVFTSFLPAVVQKKPTAVALNNLLIITGIGLLIAIFIIHSWLAGLLSLILSIVTSVITYHIHEKLFIKKLFKSARDNTPYTRIQKLSHFTTKQHFLALYKEYEKLRVSFEPLRNKLNISEINKLFDIIEASTTLSNNDKVIAGFALLALLDGSYPKYEGLITLQSTFGDEFVESIIEKQKEEL